MDRDALIDLGRSAGGLAVLEALLHWLPWNRANGDELQPPWTYVVGITPVVGFVSAWAMRRRQLRGVGFVVGLLVHVLAAGGAVIGGYVLDAWWGERNALRLRLWGRDSGTGRRVD